MSIEVLIAAFAIMLASLTGVIFVWKGFGQWTERNLKYLVTFSTGIFIVTTYTLLQETAHLGSNLILIGGVIGGVVVMSFFGWIIPSTHHHHSPAHEHEHERIDAHRVLFGDAIHNIGDGLLLVSAFLIDVRVGLAAALGIFLHEAAQEISEFFVLKEAGYSSRQALTRNFLVSGTILIGVGLGTAFSSLHELEAALLAFTGGAFLYIIVGDLLPHTARSIRRGGNAVKHAVAGITGLLLMTSLAVAAPHAHEDEHMHEDYIDGNGGHEEEHE